MATRTPLQAVEEVVAAHRIGILRLIFRQPVGDLAEKICTRAGRRPDEIPHLLDVMYRFTAMSERYTQLLAQHQLMKESHLPVLERKVTEYDHAKSVFAQVLIPMPLGYLMALEEFLAEARRQVTQSIQLITSQHPGGSTSEDVKLGSLLRELHKAGTIRPGDGSHQAILRRFAPEVARYLEECANDWLGTLRHRRDQLEHYESLAGSSIEFYAARHRGPVRSGMKVHSVEGERMLLVMESILRGATNLAVQSLAHLSNTIPKGSIENRVETQVHFDELRRQLSKGEAIAIATMSEVSEVSWDDVDSHIKGGGAPPPLFEFVEP